MVKQKVIEIIDKTNWLVTNRAGKKYPISVEEELAEQVDFPKLHEKIEEEGSAWCDVGFSKKKGAFLLFVDYNFMKEELTS